MNKTYLMMTDGNAAFYEQMKLENFMEFARLTGFDTGIDIDVLYPHIKDADTVVELGAGYGRAIDFLLKKGFEGELIAVDRIQRLVDGLRERFGKRVSYIQEDIKNLQLPHTVDAIIWLWSGVLELTVPEQRLSVLRLYQNLKPGGLLALESPHKQIKIVGQHASSQHIKLSTDWGELNAYLPTEGEIGSYAQEAGFSGFEKIYYKTPAGLDRVFYMLRK